jgi:hypothetical protein
MNFEKYACGHYKERGLYKIYESLNINEKKDFIKWKYTIGSEGTREYCLECYKKGKNI